MFIGGLARIWLIMFGELGFDLDEDQNNDIIAHLHIVSMTGIMTILLINLLIAIMSDTYNRIMVNIESANYMIMNGLIMWLELVLFSKR